MNAKPNRYRLIDLITPITIANELPGTATSLLPFRFEFPLTILREKILVTQYNLQWCK